MKPGKPRTVCNASVSRGEAAHRPLFGALAYICVLLSTPPSAVADTAIVVGGGYDVLSSQAQIELNVQWAGDILRKRGFDVSTYFTDGDDPAADVHYLLPPGESGSSLEPLARVFGNSLEDRTRFRSHALQHVSGGTSRDTLQAALARNIAEAGGDDLLLIFNGHGGQSPAAIEEVTMNLWNDTALSAADLHAVIADSASPFRFVMTQCYSGGFHRVAFAEPASGLALAGAAPRCGFTAASPYQVAEGCSASIETDDYRDYSTYFFAALSGYERGGDILGIDPDIDSSGETSLREAHLYSLGEAVSSDLPWSTSEFYLDQWQPWHLRWLPVAKGLPNNEYARLFRDLAGRTGIALDRHSARSIQSEATRLGETLHTLYDRQSALHYEIGDTQYLLQMAVLRLWPELSAPYTLAFERLAAAGALQLAADTIRQMPPYGQLLQQQADADALQQQILDTERNLTQLQKLQHLRRLAHLKGQLYRYGSAEAIARYESLIGCESYAPESGS